MIPARLPGNFACPLLRGWQLGIVLRDAWLELCLLLALRLAWLLLLRRLLLRRLLLRRRFCACCAGGEGIFGGPARRNSSSVFLSSVGWRLSAMRFLSDRTFVLGATLGSFCMSGGRSR